MNANKHDEIYDNIYNTIGGLLEAEQWKGFMQSAAYNYKYDFMRQVAIYSQRPDAKACAPYDFWTRVGRYVKRGSAGIAVPDETTQKMNYLFDISDTGTKVNYNDQVFVWQINREAFNEKYGTNWYQALSDEIKESITSRNIIDELSDNQKDVLFHTVLYQTLYRIGVPQEQLREIDFTNLKNLSFSEFLVVGRLANEQTKESINQLRYEFKDYIEREAQNDSQSYEQQTVSKDQRILDSGDKNQERTKTDQEIRTHEVEVSQREREAFGYGTVERTRSNRTTDELSGEYRGGSGENQGIPLEDDGGTENRFQSSEERLSSLSTRGSTNRDGIRRNNSAHSNLRIEDITQEISNRFVMFPPEEATQKEVIQQDMASFLNEQNNKTALDMDMDNDGVIDRYDADYRDSTVQSIGQLDEREEERNREDENEDYELGYFSLGNGYVVSDQNINDRETNDFLYLAHINADRTIDFYNATLSSHYSPGIVDKIIGEVCLQAMILDGNISFTQNLKVLNELSPLLKIEELSNGEIENLKTLLTKIDFNSYIEAEKLNPQVLSTEERVREISQLALDVNKNKAKDQVEQSLPESNALSQQLKFNFPPTPITQEVIDTILVHGGNVDGGRLAIVAEFSKDKSIEELGDFLKQSFKGGNGFYIDDNQIAAYYTDEGLQIAHGTSAKESYTTISWEEVAKRTDELLQTGDFATKEELENALTFEREKIAESLWYLIHDLNAESTGSYFKTLKNERRGFSEDTKDIAALLSNPVSLQGIKEEYSDFLEAYKDDKDLLRFNFHKVDDLYQKLSELELKRRAYKTNLTENKGVKSFITEDEIYDFFHSGSGMSGGKERIYRFFTEDHGLTEKAEFLRDEYGTGGRMPVFPGSSSSQEEHDSRGVKLEKENCSEVFLTWSNAAKYVDDLILQGLYLDKQETNLEKDSEDKSNNYWIVEFNENDPLIPDYSGQLVTQELINDIKEKDQLVFNHNRNVGIDANNEMTDDYMGYFKFYFDHYVDGERIEHRRIDIGDGEEANAQEFAYLEDQLLRIKEEPIKQQVVSTLEKENFEKIEGIEGNFYLLNRKQIPKGVLKEPSLIKDSVNGRLGYEADLLLDLNEQKLKSVFLYNGYWINNNDFDYESYADIEAALVDLTDRSYTGNILDEFTEASAEKYELNVREVQNVSVKDEKQSFDLVKDFDPPSVRLENNIKALEVLKRCENESRYATSDERKILGNYVGWGGLADVFNETKGGQWERSREIIKQYLSEEEYESAKESTLTSFYTSNGIIDGIYSALENMGFKGGNVLEPSAGIGNFIGNLPKSLEPSSFHAVEQDTLSGRIAKQLYPEATIEVSGFEDVKLQDDYYDIAIGNVPFGNYKLYDEAYSKQNFLIHDYFFAKSLDKVHDGGIVAFITSKGTMDKTNSEFLNYMADRAKLVGAIRLPEEAFKQTGTSVTSDILFFQKGENSDRTWNELGRDENGISLNQYFIEHPEMIIGTMVERTGPFGKVAACQLGDKDFSVLFEEAIKNLPKGIYKEPNERSIEPKKEENQITAELPDLSDVEDYTYCKVGDKIYYKNENVVEEISQDVELLSGMIELRDTVKELYYLEYNNFDSKAIDEEMEKLNSVYDEFVEKHGRINEPSKIKAFRGDDSIAILLALEELDNDGKFEQKADVFRERVIKGVEVPEHTEDLVDAVILSLNHKGRIDLNFMSEIMGRDSAEIKNDLLEKKLAFKSERGTGELVYREDFLSGDIRKKIETFQANIDSFTVEERKSMIEALESAIPEAIKAKDISFRLGSTWIPERYISDFCREVLGGSKRIEFSEATSKWYVPDKGNDWSVYSTTKFGTRRMNSWHILEKTLNQNERLKIEDTIYVDGKEQKVLNKKETILVQQKQEYMKQEFANWLFSDPQRTSELEKIYNERFNNIVIRKYTGENLPFSGMNPLISLRPHQKDVVAKSIFHGNTLAAHTVGAGKTFSAIAAIMESKRLGLSSKAMIAVPNHLTEQWGRDFLKLYPDAKVLVATKKDFEKKNRHKLMAKIASGNYDAVIVGHSQFGMIPVSQEYEKRFLQEQLKELDLKLNSCNKYTQGFSVKQLQQKKKKLESKIKTLMNEKRRDDIVNFEEMGIDKLVVDEAHEFKNLQIPTSLTGVSGISNSASQKAYDLYMKTKYLDEKTGRKGLLFLTGTPVSNSMCELFVMQKYLNNEDLARTRLLDFDAWASTFGEIKNVLELSVDGTNYKMKTKFNRFNNMPELKKQFLNFADIKMPESLDLPVPDLKSEVVKVKPSELQKEIIEDLSSRADKVKSGIDPRIDNMLKITNDGRKLALDQRVFDPMLPDEDNSKVNACVDKIVEIYNQTMDSKSTQIVFSDLSVPNKDEFNVHHDLKEKLIKKGLKSQEIAFIHDANTPAEKEKLFAKVRSGDVRVIIGTTQKMGTGTNMQDRAIALHHLDCPWRPADREQRLGRMVRQGNENKEVFEYTYITEGTFDAYMYQILENKQRFISQLMTEESALRSIEDVDEITLNYAEIKALCANNPLIKEKMELENDVNRLSIEKAGYLQSINQLKNQIANVYPETMKKLENNMNVINMDLEKARRSENKPFEMKINGIIYQDEKEAAKAFTESYQGSIKKTTPFAEYEGFKVFIDYSSIDKQYILNIEGEERSYKELASKAGHWNITRIKNMTSPEYFEELITSTDERLKEQQRNLETAKEEVLKPFINEEEYVEKMNRLTEINLKFNDGDISFDQSLEEAKEKLSEFCIASQGYSDIDFTDLGDVHLVTKKIDGQRKIDISCNLLDQPELITKLNGEIIDIRKEQSLEDFIKLNITSLDLSQHIHKLKETGKLELSEKTNKEVTKHDRFEDRDDR